MALVNDRRSRPFALAGNSTRALFAVVLFASAFSGIIDARASNELTSTDERDAHLAELDAVARDIALTAEREEELKREIEALDKDDATLNETLIGIGGRVQALEREIDGTEQRLRGLSGNIDAIRSSLAERRDVLSEVLAKLQRMGRRPLPAIVVEPEDALTAVRSAILLGAVVPELRQAADQLAADLSRLVTLRVEFDRQRDRLRADAISLAEERTRVRLLIEEKKSKRGASATALAKERRRAKELDERATSLRDLIAILEEEIAKERGKDASTPTSRGGGDWLTPVVSFAKTRGLLPRPANGRYLRRFGEKDDLGGIAKGDAILTTPGAQVISPADGLVEFAGSHRGYGELLIINTGGGYRIVMWGMERIDVERYRFVLAGEPIAAMGTQQLGSAAGNVLEIEFWKDRSPVDPAPWWAVTSEL